jgi:hypothetical protein
MVVTATVAVATDVIFDEGTLIWITILFMSVKDLI